MIIVGVGVVLTIQGISLFSLGGGLIESVALIFLTLVFVYFFSTLVLSCGCG